MNEEWKPIPGYEELYEVSNQCRVRSRTRITPHGNGGTMRTINGRILKTSRNNGYLVAYLGGNGTTGEPPKKFYVEAAVENIFDLKPKSLAHLDKDGEEWRDVAGYEGLYQVSNLAQVRSVGWHTTSAKGVINGGATKRRYIRPHILTGGTGTAGYPKVELANRGVIKTLLVHRLVATAFVPNPLKLAVVHHRDENKMNNRPENLEWTSRAGNVQDWFDRRRIVVSTDTIESVLAAAAAGKSPAEILASLPRRRKPRKTEGESGH